MGTMFCYADIEFLFYGNKDILNFSSKYIKTILVMLDKYWKVKNFAYNWKKSRIPPDKVKRR